MACSRNLTQVVQSTGENVPLPIFPLAFTESKALGDTDWDYTSANGTGSGGYDTGYLIDGTGSYQFSVKQGLATLNGTKNDQESLSEGNYFSIGFAVTPDGDIDYDLTGFANQTFSKEFDYDGCTGSTSYGCGNGVISLDESGAVSSSESRSVDWSYQEGSYDAEVRATKTTSGSHGHVYDDDYDSCSCGYSYSDDASWSENSVWNNILTKYNSLTDSSWSNLWRDRFTSYDQSGCASGDGAKATSYSSYDHNCGCGYSYSDSDNYDYEGCWSESYDSANSDYAMSGAIDNHVTGNSTSCGCGCSYDEYTGCIDTLGPVPPGD